MNYDTSLISSIKDHGRARGRGIDIGGGNEIALGIGLGLSEEVEVVKGLVVSEGEVRSL